jgi:hypothetical protein
MKWLSELPSTNARIAVSLLLALATGVRVLASWEAPPTEWLVFLAAMMGLDVAQFAAKRATYRRRR